MDPNSNEYLTNPANIYVRNSKPPKNTILIDLKNQQKPHVQIHHVFKKRDIRVTEFKVPELHN